MILRQSSQQNVPNHEITFYDSVTGEALFVAPRGRSMEAFLAESRAHGWPSFRDEEVKENALSTMDLNTMLHFISHSNILPCILTQVVWSNVRILPDGEAVSASGSHLGHNIPDRSGNRYSACVYVLRSSCFYGLRMFFYCEIFIPIKVLHKLGIDIWVPRPSVKPSIPCY
jgi:hypothetical protein